MNSVRIVKFLAECGLASRRKAADLIKQGLVQINGQVVEDLSTQVNCEHDEVKFRNQVVKAAPKGLMLFHKPREVVCTLSDPEGRPCVKDYLPKGFESYFPVGRLDWDTSGLLLLTNDGALANNLMHPRYEVERVYHAQVTGCVNKAKLDTLRCGVKLDDGLAMAEAKILKSDEKTCWLELRLAEGRNREVRRMLEAIGHPVIELKRVAFGPFKLGNLKSGKLQQLSPAEFKRVANSIISP